MINIGKLIYEIRTQRNMTQEELANALFCNRTYISHLENNKRNLKKEFIHPLSKALKFNFTQFLHTSHKFKKLDHYLETNKILTLVDEMKYHEVKEILSNKIIKKEFDYGYPLFVKKYSTALTKAMLENNLLAAEKLLYDMLNIDSRDSVKEFTPIFYEEERYFSGIVLLSYVLYKLGRTDSSRTLLLNTVNFLETHFFSEKTIKDSVSIYLRKLYITLLNNYANVLFDLKELDTALLTCDKALTMFHEYEVNFSIELVLKLKMQILYEQKKYSCSQKIYNDFVAICRLKNNEKYFKSTNEEIGKEYKKIKTISEL